MRDLYYNYCCKERKKERKRSIVEREKDKSTECELNKDFFNF